MLLGCWLWLAPVLATEHRIFWVDDLISQSKVDDDFPKSQLFQRSKTGRFFFFLLFLIKFYFFLDHFFIFFLLGHKKIGKARWNPSFGWWREKMLLLEAERYVMMTRPTAWKLMASRPFFLVWTLQTQTLTSSVCLKTGVGLLILLYKGTEIRHIQQHTFILCLIRSTFRKSTEGLLSCVGRGTLNPTQCKPPLAWNVERGRKKISYPFQHQFGCVKPFFWRLKAFLLMLAGCSITRSAAFPKSSWGVTSSMDGTPQMELPWLPEPSSLSHMIQQVKETVSQQIIWQTILERLRCI